jgi:hypothetical protein
MALEVTPGIHAEAKSIMNSIIESDVEKKIIKYWALEWYVTKVDRIKIRASDYRYIFVKPTPAWEESIGVSRELVVIFSDYSRFEPRTLDAFDLIAKKTQDQRLERICYVLVSKDVNIEEALRTCLSNQESQIIIPFTYDSFLHKEGNDNYFLRNHFSKHFHRRDLYDFSDALKKDFYFFGRNDTVIDIIDKHHQFQNSGLFGLRKTGKTSILYDVIRKTDQARSLCVLIDCQDPAFHTLRWYHAVQFLIVKVITALGTLSAPLQKYKETEFTEKNASENFQRFLILTRKETGKSILFLFDEVENITYGKSPSSHWCVQLDSVFFWQTIRSVYQQTQRLFSFCLVGTNPKCIEDSQIEGKDNPIFNLVQPKYIKGFDVNQTREMVRKLGRLMGIKYEEEIYAKLTEDYGGHPFLIRLVCSIISKNNPSRPVLIDRRKYNEAKKKFNRENDYFSMILDVLKQFYEDELEMLHMLSIGQEADFEELAEADYSYVKHLIGYGLIRENDGKYDFKIDAIKDYLVRISKRKPIHDNDDDKWQEIVSSRNAVEVRLRNMIRKVIRICCGSEAKAKQHLVKQLFIKRQGQCESLTYDELFDPNKNEIYFNDLKTIIRDNWPNFLGYFPKQSMLLQSMDIVNDIGRKDAHAKAVSDEEMNIIRYSISYIEKGINKFDLSIK